MNGEQSAPADADMLKRVMFLCSGNYYRGRICEESFNSLAASRNMTWTAISRALLENPAQLNSGPMSPLATELLQAHGIRIQAPLRLPLQVTELDFEFSSIVIAVNEQEHRPLIDAHWPAWRDLVAYWRVADGTPPSAAFSQLFEHTAHLIELISARRCVAGIARSKPLENPGLGR